MLIITFFKCVFLGNMRDLKSQIWFQTKITWHKAQLLLYYIHLESQNSVSKIHDLLFVKIFCLSSSKLFCRKVQKFFFFHFPAICLVSLTSNCSLYFSRVSSLAEKKMRFRAKEWCDSWINRGYKSQSNYKDHRWFKKECNEGWNFSFMISWLITFALAYD